MSSTRWRGLPIVMLVLVIGAVFCRVPAGDFQVWDDRDMVWGNARLVPPEVGKALEFWTTPCRRLYTPMSYTVWSAVAAAENRAAGEQLTPGAFHVLSVVLHMLAAMFVFLLLRELTGAVWPAWAGAALFAVHPLQVEAVAWIAPTNGVLCGVFVTLALWQYVLYAKSPGGGGRHLTVAGAAYLAALLSKPTGVVTPLIAAAIDLWVLRRPLRKVVWPVGAALLMGAPMMVITRLTQPAPALADMSWMERLFVAADATGFYIQKLFVPVGLTADYERTPHWLMAHPWSAWPGLALVAGGVLVFGIGRKLAWLRGALAIVPAALAPVLGLAPFDFQYYSTVADRYMYLPMIGAGLGFAMLLQRCNRKAAVVLAAAGLSGLAALSFAQTGVWRNTGTLTARQLAFDPHNSTGHKLRAEWLSSQNERADAEKEFRAAIAALQAEGRDGEGGVWYGLGNLLLREGRFSEAIEIYRQALPRMSADQLPLGHNNLGIALYRTGELDSAREEFRAALSLDPNLNQARQNLSRLGGS
jgi:hypothetical protein